MGDKKYAVAMGFFDGIHLGHKALLDKTVQRARELEAAPAAISFDTHPDNMVTGKQVKLINSTEDKEGILSRNFGIEDTIVLHFDEDMMHMKWDAFLEWIVEYFRILHIVAGYDFHFGYKGEGNPERLAKKCAEMGVGCDIVEQVQLDGITVSSTFIRDLLSKGDMEKANQYLGHPHTLSDTVRCGYKVGRKLGLPTINMRFQDDVISPARGVYASRVYLPDGRNYMGVTNIGVRPTMGGKDVVSVESHILDYSGNLYGRDVRVEFYKFLRPERKFASPEELKKQIETDIQTTRTYFKNR